MHTFHRIALIANPASQNGRVASAIRYVLEDASKLVGSGNVTLFETKCAGHGTKLARELGSHFDAIFAMGGDGLVHEVVNGLMAKDSLERQVLGVIPVGSGNDFAASLGMASRWPRAFKQIFGGNDISIDLGCCNGEYFAETLSFGIDAAIALGTVPLRKRTNLHGAPLYVASAANQLVTKLRKHEFHLELTEGERISYDGGQPVSVSSVGSLEGECYLLAVQNGPSYGGGFKVCPGANLSDGKLDLVLVRPPINPAQAAALMARAKGGHHTNSSAFEFYRARGFSLTFDDQVPTQLDGEPHIAPRFDVKVEPGALRVFEPAASR